MGKYWFPRPSHLLTLTLTAVLLAACAVNPVTREREFSLVSEAEEVRIGEQAYPVYTQMSEGEFQDPGLQAYVSAVGKRLAAASHRPELDYQFNVVNDSAINAYALPGGKISFTRGLLTQMTNESQMASVLGHEVGHVTARHSAAGMTRQKVAGALTAVGAAALEVAGVQGSEMILQGGMIATNLVLQKYSRDQERQSDQLGMQYMTALGYNPEGMAQTMEILDASHQSDPSAVESLFMSHPLTSERIASARQLSAAQDPALRTPGNLREAPFRTATARLKAVAPAYAKMDAGKAALAEGDTAKAVTLLRDATTLAPDQALIWAFRAAAEVKAGDAATGLASAEQAVKLYPGLFRARFTAGGAALETGRHQRSMEHLAAADKIVPGQPQVTYLRGRNLEAQGQQEDAAKSYYEVLQNVRKGPMAEYCYKRLVEWGYVKPQG
ncbi:MAG: M48 family metalloprotease [Deferrisomatales bacterium]|nr:M48 family metalloprotease [Deferrisomatales bacterium]